MIKTLINRLFLIREISSKEGIVHFRRYRILETEWFSIYIHNILESDKDIHSHNHPWNFLSIILYGGYEESRSISSCSHFASKLIIKWFTQMNINEFHKIKLLKNSCWTLVFTGKRINPNWGYLTKNGFIGFEEYRNAKNKGTLNE